MKEFKIINEHPALRREKKVKDRWGSHRSFEGSINN